MRAGPILKKINKGIEAGYGCYWILLDPDDFSDREAARIASEAQKAGADAMLIGGSLLNTNHLDSFVSSVKKAVNVPVILFPGDATQISSVADAILFFYALARA